MELIKPGTKIDFVSKMKWAAILSFICILATFILGLTKKLNYGIDFAGGIEIQIEFLKPVEIGRLRDALKPLALGDVEVKRVGGEASDRGYIIRTEMEEAGEKKDTVALLTSSLGERFGGYDENKLYTSLVGPRAGAEMRKKGFQAVFFSLVFLLIYIAVRFDLLFAIGGILALFHDVVITMGAIILTGREFNLTTIAALLTIVGYSINDTIVIYDRIRENSKKFRLKPFRDLVNASTNETLSRTILTSLTVLFTVSVFFIMGRGTIKDFAFALLVGMVSGVYSTVFIASAFVIFWKNYIGPRFTKKRA